MAGFRKTGPNDEVREVLKHGTLSIGYIGLAETLTALYGKHHGESEEMQQKGLEIIGHMRAFTDAKAKETKMNYTLLATPAEGLSGRFIRMTRNVMEKLPELQTENIIQTVSIFRSGIRFPRMKRSEKRRHIMRCQMADISVM